MMQKGMMTTPVDLSLGGISLKNIPSTLHILDKISILYSSKVEANIGLFVLDQFDQFFDLKNKKIILYKNSKSDFVVNPIWGNLTQNEDGVLIKSLLIGGCGEISGLAIRDIIESINGNEIKSLASAYAQLERQTNSLSIKVKRNNDLKLISLTCLKNLPIPKLYPQSFYGIKKNDNAASKQVNLKIQNVNAARIIFYGINANFSLLNNADLNSDQLLFKRFNTNVYFEKNNLSVEGMNISEKGIKVSLNKTTPSLSIDNTCKKIEDKIYHLSSNENSILIKRNIKGCNKELELLFRVSLYKKLDTAAQKSPFLFLKDEETKLNPIWKSEEIVIALDQRFLPDEVNDWNWAIENVNKNFKIKLKVESKNLSTGPIGAVGENAIYKLNESQSGNLFDFDKKFGVTLIDFDPYTSKINDAQILIREVEFKQYEKMLDAMIRPKMQNANIEVINKLLEFKESKVKEMRKNVYLHELGHFLGLAHNFSNKEKSIMNYSNSKELSDYDLQALKYLYENKKPDREFELKDEAFLSDNKFD